MTDITTPPPLVIPKLGKTPARPRAIPLKFSTYINLSVLPPVPKNFGFDQYIPDGVGPLGNDIAGDCVEAGAANEEIAWDAEGGVETPFTPECVLSDYTAVVGYNPNDPATDVGTDMVEYANYRKTVGILDANGKRHKIGAFVEIEVGNVEEILTAAWIFGTVGIGIQFPQSAMDQYFAGEAWKVVQGSQIIGGHYVPFIRRRGAWGLPHLGFVRTWGSRQGMGDDFVREYMDEGIVYISAAMLKNGLSVDGFDMQQLQDDLIRLGDFAIWRR